MSDAKEAAAADDRDLARLTERMAELERYVRWLDGSAHGRLSALEHRTRFVTQFDDKGNAIPVSSADLDRTVSAQGQRIGELEFQLRGAAEALDSIRTSLGIPFRGTPAPPSSADLDQRDRFLEPPPIARAIGKEVTKAVAEAKAARDLGCRIRAVLGMLPADGTAAGLLGFSIAEAERAGVIP